MPGPLVYLAGAAAVAAGKALLKKAAQSPAVRKAVVNAGKKAGQAFSKGASKAKQACKNLWRKARGQKSKDDLLKESKRGKTSSSRQWEKDGGFNQANKDFDSLKPDNIQNYPNNIRVGKLEDGTTVIVRNAGGRPTLEFQPLSGKVDKIRYGN